MSSVEKRTCPLCGAEISFNKYRSHLPECPGGETDQTQLEVVVE